MNSTNTATRNYLGVALAALLLQTAVLFVRTEGNLLLSLCPALLGLAGLFARFTLFPFLGLLSVVYLLIFPMGGPWSSSREFGNGHFRVVDLVLVGSTLTYFMALFRSLALRSRAMPIDRKTGSRGMPEPPITRPEKLVSTEEFRRLFIFVGVVVFLGQVLWFLLAEFRAVPSEFPPIRIANNFETANRTESASAMILFSTVFIMSFTSTVLLFWYWRWSGLNPLEAKMYLLDSQWSFARREMSRQETWRAAALPQPVTATYQPQSQGCGWLSLKMVFLGLALFVLAIGGWIFVIIYLIRRI